MLVAVVYIILYLIPLVSGASTVVPAKISIKDNIATKTGQNYVSSVLNMFLTKTLGHDDKTYGCTIEITNKMNNRNLVNPRVFLERGYTKVPPPLRISAGGESGKSDSIGFEADDKFAQNYVSKGVLSYEIRGDRDVKVLYIFWSVTQEASKIMWRENNYFNMKLEDAGTVFEGVSEMKMKSVRDELSAKPFETKAIGEYIQINDKGFLARAHMTDNKVSQLVVTVMDNGVMNDAYNADKRDFGASLAVGLATTGLSIVTNRLINYFGATRGVVITLQNDFSQVIEHPIWRASGVEIQQPIPWQFGPEQVNQISVNVPFGSGDTFWEKFKSSVFVISYQIRGTTQRIAFLVKWAKAFSLQDISHKYSVFLMNDLTNVKEVLQKVLNAFQNNDDPKQVDTVLRNDNPPINETVLSPYNSVLLPSAFAGTFRQYQSWRYPVQGNQVLAVLTLIGSQSVSAELKVYLRNDLGGPPPEHVNPSNFNEK